MALLLATLTLAFAGDGAWPELPAPVSGSGGDGSRDAAVVIAIEDYFAAPDLPEARSNGLAWVEWLRTARKVPLVKPIFDENATREQILADVAAVARQVRSGGRLWVIFIGHGAPSKDGKDGLLEGVDAQQNAMSLEARGVRRSELLAIIEGGIPDRASAVLLIDACFSGRTAAGDLAPGLAPMRAAELPPGERVTVLTAAANNQYAGPLSDQSRPAFSYLVLGALRGWGDDGDGAVRASEAVAYADRALLTTVSGRQQSPSWSGPDLTLSSATRREDPDLTSLALGSSAEIALSRRRTGGESPARESAPSTARVEPEATQPWTAPASGGSGIGSEGSTSLLGPSAYVDFVLDERWDLETTVGLAMGDSSGMLVGIAAQYDTPSFFQLQLGVLGSIGDELAVGPDIAAGFVW